MMLNEMAAQPGRYILAAPRKDLIEEHVVRLRALATSHGRTPKLKPIHSDQGPREPVGRRVAEALEAYDMEEHVVIAITHEALIALEGAALTCWHVRIDEIPDGAILSSQVSIRTSWPALAARYALEPSGVPGQSVIRLRPDVDNLPLSAITEDVGQKLVGLHRAIATSTRTVIVDIDDWADASLTGRRVNWWSIWSLDVLVGCDSIVLTGASYVGSVLQRVMEGSTRITVTLEEVTSSVRTDSPRIQIHYYTRHPGSTSWWQTDDGSRCLVQISRHLESIGFRGYWACNDVVVPYFRHRFPVATPCTPKQAGSNSLREHTACVMIYSNKAQASDMPIIDVLSLDENDIRSMREDEDIYQFALRGSLRDVEHQGVYDIYVYDEAQAERLRHRLISQRYGDVILVPVDAAGIMEIARPTSNHAEKASQPHKSSAEQREQNRLKERERGRRRREMLRDQRQTEGTLRKPGRPKSIPNLGTVNEMQCQHPLDR
jgi:hypothetical protein